MADIKIYGTLYRDDQNADVEKIVKAKQVEGGFFVSGALPDKGAWDFGQICYNLEDNNFYQYSGDGENIESSWTLLEIDARNNIFGGFFVSYLPPHGGNYQVGQLCYSTSDSRFYQCSGYDDDEGVWTWESMTIYADQVDGLNDAIAATEAEEDTDYYITGVDADNPGFKYNTDIKFKNGQINAASFNATSDARLKENFKPLDTEKSILDLPTYKYDFIDGAKNQIGCKAQELQEICPEIVVENSDGYLSIQESKIIYLLLEEVKKLRKEVDDLRAKG